MSDPRVQRMARVLVHHSLELRRGDRLAILATPLAAPLIREVVREAVRAGAHVSPLLQLPGLSEIILKEASEEQLTFVSPLLRLIWEEYEALLDIESEENTAELSGVDPARLALAQQASREMREILMKRTQPGQRHDPQSLRWAATMFPTPAYAQNTGMSLSDFEDFLYSACFLDDEDPVARWAELHQQQERLVEWLSTREEANVELRGPDVELTLSYKGRRFVSDDGRYNLPGGEIFTSPLETSANGWIRFRFPCSAQGVSVEDVRLRLENGVVVEAQAAHGQLYLDRMLAIDEGARRLGEFAIGNNYRVQRITKHPLFDEKFGGTIHLALGASYPETGGGNQSAIHWDLVCDMRQESEIRVDGLLFYKDGHFVV
ncbi:aminopeptidase [Thermogemmatispora aurantia]|uniref:Aminopeptidase n=1 Tax=Thermogemmatispora aurantia TaxID=2045279 RepID=A0A5J4KG08_9CHLR|nr:aminopeptidase [Thermogemmatispora aurantia]GER85682.1 aminopeptidase [Thermogemmatispora aurantia]